MSFVDHHGEVEYPFSQKTVFDALMAAVPKMDSFELDSADEVSGRVTLKAGVSLRSWGENIPIQLVQVSPTRTRMQIVSTPKTGMLFGGANDLGKNRQNIERIIKAVSDVLATKEPEKEQQQVNVTDELVKLKQLLDQGVLSQEEFDDQKKKLLSGTAAPAVPKQPNTTTTKPAEPVRIESKGNDNTMVYVIIGAIAFFIFMMLVSM